MDIEDYSNDALRRALEAEIAKSTNELRCALGDMEKINARLRFCLLALNTMKDRKDQR